MDRLKFDQSLQGFWVFSRLNEHTLISSDIFISIPNGFNYCASLNKTIRYDIFNSQISLNFSFLLRYLYSLIYLC
jgi:hypothetical protein